VQNGRLVFDTAEAVRFLLGDWLEAMCLRALRERFAN
jgi:hypothetical protein